MSVEDYSETNAYRCLEKLTTSNKNIRWTIVPDNTTGLSELYNNKSTELITMYNYNDDDIIVCIHDDVEIHDLWFVEKLITAHKQYDIIGLAGASAQDYSNTSKPTVWHLSIPVSNALHGIVSHAIPADKPYVNSVDFGPTPHPVVVIDGLLMSFKCGVLKQHPNLFDNDMKWHHYDMAMCARAIQANLTIGVWPIFVIHHGLGQFNNDPEWHATAQIFRKNYGTIRHIL